MRPQAILLLSAFVWAVPHDGNAQAKTPGENTVAIGASVGFHAIDTENDDVAANLDGFIEYYYTPRASIRAMYSWAEPTLQGAPRRTVRQRRVLVNFLYHWDFGRFRPFITVGGGAYVLQHRADGESIGRRQTKPAGNLGGDWSTTCGRSR